MNPLSRTVLRAATVNFAKFPNLSRKLSWWLEGGHSSERWFQLEWGFALQRVIADRCHVLCECHWKDIVCVQRPARMEPLWKNPIAASAELKWFGNWSAQESDLRKIKKDIKKIDGYSEPAAALVFLLLVATGSAKHHRWMDEQIRDREGVGTATEFKDRMVKETGQQPRFTLSVPMAPTKAFTQAELHLFGYRNKAALSHGG